MDAWSRGEFRSLWAVCIMVPLDDSGKEKYLVLLQNRWKKMSLIRMSAKYLVDHLDRYGALLFYTDKLSSMPTSFNFCGGLIQEGSFDDDGEEDENVMDVDDSQFEEAK